MNSYASGKARSSRATNLLVYVRINAFGRRHIGFGAGLVSYPSPIEASKE